MSRIVSKNRRGWKPLLSTPKLAKMKESLDETCQGTNDTRQKQGRKYAPTVQQAKKRKRAPSTPPESSASSSDAEDEASEDDSESDEDEPLDNAPSLNSHVGQAGRPFRQNEFDDAISDAGSVASMFDPNFHFENGDPDLFPMVDMNNKVFADLDDDNDEVYNAVDDISDSDDEDVEAFEERDIIATLSEDEIGEGEFVNQIDGLSEYGFGNESDDAAHYPPSTQGSDTEPVHQRHVHFHVDAAHALQSELSSSPTISRALLPSALPEHGGVSGGLTSALLQDSQELPPEDVYDSDATEEDVPVQASQQAATRTQEIVDLKTEEELPKLTPKPASKKSQRKGPPRGIFIDEGTKASGILDPTGKIMLITHPHLLGEAFARRYGNSAPASPSVGFQELIDGSEAGDSQIVGEIAPAATADSLRDALAVSVTDPISGQSTGLQEPFYPAPGIELGDYEFQDGGFDDDDDLGEDVIKMDDVIKFDDSDDSDDVTSPIYMPPREVYMPSKRDKPRSFANANITAFRNNADPNFSPFSSADFSQLAELSTPIHRTPNTRKRKRTVDSPYSSSHYAGVTPIQRMRDPNPPSAPATPESFNRPKRQRQMTA